MQQKKLTQVTQILSRFFDAKRRLSKELEQIVCRRKLSCGFLKTLLQTSFPVKETKYWKSASTLKQPKNFLREGPETF